MALSLVPSSLAKAGLRFFFRGDAKDDGCDGCSVRNLCFAIEPGHHYEVINQRPVEHPCNLHDGKVQVVEVERRGFGTTLGTKHLRGTAATWQPLPCRMPECPNWQRCNPHGPARSVRYAIDRVGEAVECPAGYDLRFVDLSSIS